MKKRKSDLTLILWTFSGICLALGLQTGWFALRVRARLGSVSDLTADTETVQTLYVLAEYSLLALFFLSAFLTFAVGGVVHWSICRVPCPRSSWTCLTEQADGGNPGEVKEQSCHAGRGKNAHGADG